MTAMSMRRRHAGATVGNRLESTIMGARAIAEAATPPNRTFGWMRPSTWGISARSAILSATVVFVALAIAGAFLVVVLYRSLLASVDAAAGRVRDIVAGLAFDPPSELDGALLTTDQRVVAVQIIDGDGKVVAHSDSAPDRPIIPVTSFGTTMRTGIPDDESPDNDMRISGQVADTSTGRYTVLAAAGVNRWRRRSERSPCYCSCRSDRHRCGGGCQLSTGQALTAVGGGHPVASGGH